MMQLEFDETIGRALERLYATRDMIRRRQLVRSALAARPGERALDVGCGPGFYLAELADEVGPQGAVVGVDPSPAMLTLASRRCAGLQHVELLEGGATALPVEDGAFDAAVCVQVLEYVADVDAAVAELHRALRPGGRLVVWDVDWATLSMQSDDRQRLERALAAWDRHLEHPSLPRTLSTTLRGAGFEDVVLQGHAFATNELDPETYGGANVAIIGSYLKGLDGFPADEAEAWAAEQRALGERGAFYSACVQCCVSARRGA